ncbi:MAG: SCO family protein [Anaeromyxobacteraceae bacterium]|nr:SCO family protein [Anaeromyxobacteraceae bacterium]
MSRALAAALSLLAAAPGLAAEGAAAGAAPDHAAEAAREEKARAWFTDTILVDQAGREVRFYSDVLKGRTVCLSFQFTECREACPLIMAKLGRVRRDLGEAFGRDVHFVVLSVDPEHDTPEAFRRFAKVHGAEEPGWTYLTGSKAAMQAVLTRLGTWVDDPSDHTTAFVAGNARTRHWTKIRPDLPPVAVAELLRGLAEERPGARPAAAAAR